MAAATTANNKQRQQTEPQRATQLSLSSSSSLSGGGAASGQSNAPATSQQPPQPQPPQLSPPQAVKPAQQHKISSPKLLSPNAACEQVAAGRRKSTLSANGFFIDYSCTRRRSSAALQQQQARAQTSLDPLAKSQFLRQVISPTGAGPASHRRPSTMVAGALSSTAGAHTGHESFSAPSSGRVNSRASYSSGTPASGGGYGGGGGHHLLRPPPGHHLQRQSMSGGLVGPLGGAARSLAGSRKTSIFDPVGHSLLAPAGDPRRRRKSTMVAGGGGGGGLSPALEQAATMLAVSRQAAALRRDRTQGGGRARLAERVPVIGCSPTSICASLAALDETRRYEKLLRKLEGHKARREREKRKLGRRDGEDELMCDIDLESYGESESDDDANDVTSANSSSSTSSSSSSSSSSGGDEDGGESSYANQAKDTHQHHHHHHHHHSHHHQRHQRTVSALLRRKSQRALHDVGVLLNKVAQAQRKHRRRRKRRWRLSSAGAWRKSHGTGDAFVDGLSISSTLSFMSSQTSLHSIGRFLDGLSLEQPPPGRGYPAGIATPTESEASEDEDEDDEEIEYKEENEAACHSEGHLAGAGRDRDDDDDDDDDENNQEKGAGHLRPSRGRQRRRPASGGNRSHRGRTPSTELTLGSALDLSCVGRNNNERRRRQQQQRLDLHYQRRPETASGESASRQLGAPPGGLTKSSLVRRAMRRIAATLAGHGKPRRKSDQTLAGLASGDRGGDGDGPASTSGNQQQQQSQQRRLGERCTRTTNITTHNASYKDNEFAAGHRNNGDDDLAHATGSGNKRAHRRHGHRRRSVSMSAGLNYWHYYYYLRNNSLDELPGAFELANGGAASASALCLPIGSGGGGGGGADHQAHNADHQHHSAAVTTTTTTTAAACGGAPLLIGTGGSPMSESERRTRLYVNYSLARLEILNCRTDPVAKLAAKIEKAAGAGAEQVEVDSNWTAASTAGVQLAAANEDAATTTGFEFTQSSDSDVSLSLSTSSTNLSSSDTSRNSSSLSSRVVSTATSNEFCSLAAVAEPEQADRQKANIPGRARPLYRREGSLSSSVLSSSSHASLATVKSRPQHNQLGGELCQPPNGASCERATSGPAESARAGGPWQGQRHRHHAPPSSADWPGRAANAAHKRHQQLGGYLAPGAIDPPGEGAAAAGAHFARDAHFRFSVKSTRSSASSSSASVWSSRQSSAESSAWHDYQETQPQQPPPPPPSRPTSGAQSPLSPAQRPSSSPTSHHRRHHPHANPPTPHPVQSHNQSSVQQQQQRQQPLRQFISSGLSPPGTNARGSMASAAREDRRRARTFLSWDRLEMTSSHLQEQQQQQHTPGGFTIQRTMRPTESGRAPGTHVADETPTRRHVRGRLLSGHLGGSSESTSSSTLVGGPTSIAGQSSTLAVCRRSFKQLRGAGGNLAQQPPATSSPVGTRRWCSSSIVSRSKSFLFQRRASAKRTTGVGDKGGGCGGGDHDKQAMKPLVAVPAQRRDEQREAADKLLEQFEAQMSEAANLAHEQHQHQRQREQREQREQQQHHHQQALQDSSYTRGSSQQTQGTQECKSRLQSPRRSTVSSSPTSSLETAADPSEQRKHLRQQSETQTMRKSALCLNGAPTATSGASAACAGPQRQLDIAAAVARPLQTRAKSSISLLGGGEPTGHPYGQQPAVHHQAHHQQQQQQQQQQQFAMLQVANQQLGNRHLTSGGDTNDASAISAGASPTRFSLNPMDVVGIAGQLHGRYTSDISLQQGAFQQPQLSGELHWHHRQPCSHGGGEFNRQSSTGSSCTNTTNRNSFESAAVQMSRGASGSGERLDGAHEDLASATSGGGGGGLSTTTADGIRARAHSTGAGGGGGGASACLFANELPIVETQHYRPQQMHANSMQALARRTSRELRGDQRRLRAALSNESGHDAHVAQRSSPTNSNGGHNDDRLASSIENNRRANHGRHLEEEEEEEKAARQETNGASLHAQAVSVLRKSSFTCTVLGARQTGKRTIVICFVKLLNEFKLAADEYKKEEMLTKLVECSERLQELASRAEDLEQQEAAAERAQEEEEDQADGGQRQRRTSRLNSWLPSSGAVRHLLNLSPVSAKRRLHSVVSPLLAPKSQEHQELSQRRHTTFEPTSLQQHQQQQHKRAGIQSSSSSRLLGVHTAAGGGGGGDNLLSSSCQNANKSDTNISYQTTHFCEPELESNCAANSGSSSGGAGGGGGGGTQLKSSGHQLQVPSLDAAMLRKHSDPTGFRGAQQHQQRMSTQSPGSVFLHDGDSRGASPTTPVSSQRRHTTLVSSSVGLMNNCSSNNQQPRVSGKRVEGADHRPPSSNNHNHNHNHRQPRRQSICLSRRKRRVLLSLKELNRRKFSIRFSARRQISENLVAQIRANAERQRRAQTASARGRRRSTILQLTGGSTPGQHTDSLVLPDSFLVIYSINDRDSFEYAKSLVEQLRSLASQQAQEIPLPIVLVANKSDLERNREVKAADGRAVAKRYACKFIEISCTIGFNLDNLLVGLRTQLVLKHHIVLNSILRPGFRYKARYLKAVAARQQQYDNDATKLNKSNDVRPEQVAKKQADSKDKRRMTNKTASDNILIRLCKRYVMDSTGNDYDCDNFSKL